MGSDLGDDKEITILGRIVRWTEEGIEFEADPKPRRMILARFGFDKGLKSFIAKGDRENNVEEWENEDMDKGEKADCQAKVAPMHSSP